jgi:hypothetical protein
VEHSRIIRRSTGGPWWRALSIAAAVLVASASPVSASATKNLTLTHYEQPNVRTCVATSVKMAAHRADPTRVFPPIDVTSANFPDIDPSTLHGEGSGYKYCWKNSSSSAHYGLDPLAWAWLLYKYTPGGYLFDDYTYSSATSGTRSMIEAMYDFNDVQGALINRAHHAMVFKGATTSCSPAVESCRVGGYTISTIYVDDPWYDRNVNTPGQGSCSYTCGKIGLAPNTAIAWTTWYKYYFTSWGSQDCSHWPDGKWVAVIRKSSGLPSAPTLPDGTKDPRFGPTTEAEPGREYPEPRKAPTVVEAASTAVSDLDLAFGAAVTKHDLGSREELRTALDGGHLKHVVTVKSLVTSFPDYVLASVVGRHGLRGVAMFTIEGNRPVFAGMTHAASDLERYPVLSPTEAVQQARKAGLDVRSTPQLVWGWSIESESPYYPFYQLETTVGRRFVDQFGTVLGQLQLEAPAR